MPSQHTLSPQSKTRNLRTYSPIFEKKRQSFGYWDKDITEHVAISTLRRIKGEPVPVYGGGDAEIFSSVIQTSVLQLPGSGPSRSQDSTVTMPANENLPRELNMLEVQGDVSAFLGEPAAGKSIIKIGLSYSPALRLRNFSKAMREGAFGWSILHSTRRDGEEPYSSFTIAEAGENAMKSALSELGAKNLGGEFYLATSDQISEAWQQVRSVSSNYPGNK